MWLLVTGLYRSGTTLVEKCLDQHTALAVASQPVPLLWSGLKSAFLETLGGRDLLPLGPLFREERYRHEELTRWLDTHQVSTRDLVALEHQLDGYDGWWTPQLRGMLASLVPGTPGEVAKRVVVAAAEQRGREVRVVGLKEILIEEFLDHFAASGFVSVVVVRDPVDVVMSLFGGDGQRIMGEARPTLFHVRQWRRSVGLALRSKSLIVRYEDVVRDPLAALAPVADALRVSRDGMPRSLDSLRDQQDRPWGGNSSFGVSRPAPSPDLVRYIDALAGPELAALGYRTGWRVPTVRELAMFREPVDIRRADVQVDLSTDPVELEAEVRRLELLAADDIDESDRRSWLLDAHEEIRALAGDPHP